MDEPLPLRKKLDAKTCGSAENPRNIDESSINLMHTSLVSTVVRRIEFKVSSARIPSNGSITSHQSFVKTR
jgi:hypothetical protein